MKILVISSFLPYPLFSGGHIRLYNIIKELAKKHTLTLVCEKRSYQTEKDIAELKKYCDEVVTVERRKQWSLSNILRTGFSPFPFLLIGHKSDEMKNIVARLLHTKSFDVIHVETFYVIQNLPQTPLPVVLAEHNIEYLVYKRYAKTAPFFIRPLLYFDVAKLAYWEEFFWHKATKLIAVSEEEKKIMRREDVEVVSNGVDLERFKMKDLGLKNEKKEKKILFIGDFKWIQNRDAVEWLIKEIWPELKSKINVKLWIVGRKIPQEIRNLTNDTDIFFDENGLKETSEIFAKADILLAPIRVGGGTSFKILEAMASGIPVITTDLGKEGIDAKDREELLIATTVEEIVDGVIDLLQNDVLYKKIANNARIVIEQKYDWKLIVEKLDKVYNSAVKYG